MEFIEDNIVILLPVAILVLDAIMGYIPDRWLPYLGFVRRIIQKASEYKKSAK